MKAVLESRIGRGFAVPRQVEGNHAEALRDFLVVEQRAILASVRTRRVQAEEWNALARFLDIDALWPAMDVHAQIAAGCGLEAAFIPLLRLGLGRRPQGQKQLLDRQH